MCNLIPVANPSILSEITFLTDLYGADGYVTNGSCRIAGVSTVFENALVLSDGYTAQEESDVTALVAGWETLTLTYALNTVTLVDAITANCYLYLDTGGGYVLQPAQDDFTPLDLVLTGLVTVGQYLVFAVNPATLESGYVEFEVT